MRRVCLIVSLIAIMQPAFAADVATCKLAPDKKSVSVIMSNPYSAPMRCEVNCNMTMPGGFGTVVCVKEVAVGTKDQVMCTETVDPGHVYSAVQGSEINCPDPAAPPKPAAAKETDSKSDDDDEAAIEAEMKKMQEQGMEMLKRPKKQ